MKIKAKEQIGLLDINGVYKEVKPGETVEVKDRQGQWEVDAGRATKVEDEKK